MITGSCLCGTVRFRINGTISGIVECHCSMCRKTSGGAFGAYFVAHRADILWQGETALTQYQSSDNLTRSFCAHCGSAVTGANLTPGDGTIILAANLLDTDIGPSVIAAEHLQSKIRWHENEKSAPQFGGAFPDWNKLNP
ncbi:MAG: GFA family protein [Parvibaculum sp.]|nr:GFA family protein [Parvibaculum sp.]